MHQLEIDIMFILLCHSMSAACVISIISNALAVAVLCRSCTPKQINLQAILLLQLPYYVSVLLLTSRCKSAAAQYKYCYYLSPPPSVLTTNVD